MNATRKNIWILGGTGFIGRALVGHLAQSPLNSLHLLVHKNVPYRYLEPFNVFTGSLEDFDLTWWEKYPPDVIFHLARLGGNNMITRFLASNRGAAANKRLINYLSTLTKPPVVVYVSGSLMYGNQRNERWTDEHSRLSPVAYARYYIQGEKPWLEAQARQQIDVRFARPGWILGDASWFKVFYWDFYRKTGKIPLFGDGTQLMSLVHLNDCVGQIANLGENGAKCQNFNIFSGAPVRQEVFAEILASLLHTQTTPVSGKELKLRYGNTVCEALTSSIPLSTAYCEMSSSYKLKYPDVKTMLQETLSALEHKKSVLTKTPQESAV